MKKCCKCKLLKNHSEFGKDKNSNDGLRRYCKSCINEKQKIYNKKWKNNNSEKVKIKTKQYNDANKEKIKSQTANYRKKNKDKINLKQKIYYSKNKEQENLRTKNWAIKNKENVKKYNRDYMSKKRKDNNLFKLITNIRGLINAYNKRYGYKKNTKTHEILGCTYDEFKTHIESKWQSWMTWDNYGNPKDGIYEPNKTWDIDHIVELSTAKTEKDIIRLNHYTNLQPLCSYYNRWVKPHKKKRKSNK